MAKERDLSFSEGETWLISFALRDAGGQPLDLTGALVEWAVGPTVTGGASLLVDSDGAFIIISDAEAGLGLVSIPPADHAGVPAGEYLHELRATLADATVTVQITGRLSVGDSVFGEDGGSFGIIRTGGLQLEFDSGTTDVDPGNGEFSFNHATPSSAAFVYVDLLDRNDVDITDWLAALDDSTTTAARGHIRFTKASNEAVWHEFLITGAVVTASGYRKIPVSYIDGGGSFAAGDITTVSFSRTGNLGATGATGATGPAGANGTDPGILFTWDTATADADPGAGLLRADNADLSLATTLFFDDVDRSANNVEAHLLTWDDSTNTPKGHLYLTRASDGAQTIFRVGAVTDSAGYIGLAVTYVSGATSFTAADAISAQFYRAGDAGTSGSGLIAVQTFTTSGTYTPTGGTNKVLVCVMGGGGGGGALALVPNAQSAGGHGGGAGGYEEAFLTVPATTATITIGAGGAGGAAGANDGVTGGTSSYADGVDTIQATGGVGGSRLTGASTLQGIGTAGGAGSGGHISAIGAPGVAGWTLDIRAASGGGGSSAWGAGGINVNAGAGGSTAGNNASGFGAGGGGAAGGQNGAAVAGGNGAPGKIVISEYA